MEIEADLLAMLRALPMACWIKDSEGRYRYLNVLCQQMFGPVDGTGVGRATHDLFPTAVADELTAGDRRVLATGETVVMPIWLPDNAGIRRHFVVVKFPVPISQGTVIGGLALNLSTYSTSAWDASTYQQILDAISDMVLVKGPRSQLRWANKAFLEAYGMTSTELQGIFDAPFIEPDMTQQYAKDDQHVFATGRTLDIPEELVNRADGTVMTCHTVKSPLFDDAGNVAMAVAVIRDITERKRLELELRQAQKLESIGRLAAGMAHEINTPIQFIGDQTQFAQSAVGELLALVSHYQTLVAKVEAGTVTSADAIAVREAEVAADLTFTQQNLPSAFDSSLEGLRRVASLVKALKEFGHPDPGTMEAADINAALRSTLLVAASECRYVADTALELADLPPVICNISELQQVFLNLIVNAAHAIVDARSAERGLIRITSRDDGDAIIVSIADTGCGIPVDARAKIFDPFFTTKAVGRGTGQGLAISRMVVDKHRGSLTFETEVGRGTTFHVRIPRA